MSRIINQHCARRSEKATNLVSISLPATNGIAPFLVGTYTRLAHELGSPATRSLAPFPPGTWSGQPPDCTPSSYRRVPSHPPSSPSPIAACQWAPPIGGCPTTSFARQSIPTRTGYLFRQRKCTSQTNEFFCRDGKPEGATIGSDFRVQQGLGGSFFLCLDQSSGRSVSPGATLRIHSKERVGRDLHYSRAGQPLVSPPKYHDALVLRNTSHPAVLLFFLSLRRQCTCLGRNPEHVVHGIVVALFDHGRLQWHGLSDGSAGLSQVEEVDQAVVRSAHKVVRALFSFLDDARTGRVKKTFFLVVGHYEDDDASHVGRSLLGFFHSSADAHEFVGCHRQEWRAVVFSWMRRP